MKDSSIIECEVGGAAFDKLARGVVRWWGLTRFEPVLAVPSRVTARFRRSRFFPSFFVRERIMFGIGHWELIVILVVIFILFGHRLPSVMRSLGRGVVEFKQGMSGVGEDDPERVEKKDV
jgi:sec-independent protein translocase protein TatA